MQRYQIWTLLPLLAAAGSARGETRRAVFEGAGTELTWALKSPGPGLARRLEPFPVSVPGAAPQLAAAFRPAHPRRGRHPLGAPRASPGSVDPRRRAAELLDPGGALGQRSGVGTQQGPADDVHQPQRH